MKFLWPINVYKVFSFLKKLLYRLIFALRRVLGFLWSVCLLVALSRKNSKLTFFCKLNYTWLKDLHWLSQLWPITLSTWYSMAVKYRRNLSSLPLPSLSDAVMKKKIFNSLLVLEISFAAFEQMYRMYNIQWAYGRYNTFATPEYSSYYSWVSAPTPVLLLTPVASAEATFLGASGRIGVLGAGSGCTKDAVDLSGDHNTTETPSHAPHALLHQYPYPSRFLPSHLLPPSRLLLPHNQVGRKPEANSFNGMPRESKVQKTNSPNFWLTIRY